MIDSAGTCQGAMQETGTPCMLRGRTLTSALPQKVAPKKTQKGVRKCPQQMPQRSKSALGQAASRKMPQKPFLLTMLLSNALWRCGDEWIADSGMIFVASAQPRCPSSCCRC